MKLDLISRINLSSEWGRSMIEMLGVLAIIGILSITGILGYRAAIERYQTNETMDELNKRAIVYAVQVTSDTIEPGVQLSSGEFGDKTMLGYDVAAFSSWDARYFEVELENVANATCRGLLKNYTVAREMYVGNKAYDPLSDNYDLCGEEDVAPAMILIYNADLLLENEENPFSEYYATDYYTTDYYYTTGVYETASKAADCDSNEFFAGGRCIPCSAEGGFWLDPSQKEQVDSCLACTGRQVYGNYCMKDCYVAGINFVRYGQCYDCPTDGKSYGGLSSDAERATCETCAGYTAYGSYCMQDCYETGSNFVSNGVCYPCNTPISYGVNSDKEKATCTSCYNREVVDRYCMKKCYKKGTNFVSNGKCYSCTTGTSYQVSSDDEKETCLSCPAREIVGGYCMKKCYKKGTNFVYDGTCYSCTTEKSYRVTSEDEKETCLSCPDREIVDGYCMKKCYKKGSNFVSNGKCYSCTTEESYWVSSDDEKEICLSCPDREIVDGYCMKKCYQEGTNFVYNGKCYSCTDTKGYPVNDDEEKSRCEACPGRHVDTRSYCSYASSCVKGSQFASYGSCFSCDEIEDKTVSLDIEKELCLDCPNREIVNGHCRGICETGSCFRSYNTRSVPCDTEKSYPLRYSNEYEMCRACGRRVVPDTNQCAPGCPIGTVYHVGKGKCEKPQCISNAQCSPGQYCELDSAQNNGSSNEAPVYGTCKTDAGVKKRVVGVGTYVRSTKQMNRWTAENYCQSLGGRMATVSDFKCGYDFVGASTTGYCNAARGDKDANKTKSANLTAFKTAFGTMNYYWLSDLHLSSSSYTVEWYLGRISRFSKASSLHGLCRIN